jgi:hypothetical protein
VLDAPSATRRLEAKLAFGRIFAGSLADTYLHWLADPRSWFRRALRGIWRVVWVPIALLLLALLVLYPWRPNVLRNQPLLAPVGFDVPRDPDASNLTLRIDWTRDTDVQTHGGLAPLCFIPDSVPHLTDAALRRVYLTLQQVHVGELDAPVAGYGSQVETARVSTRLLRNDVMTDSEWSITFDDGSVLFLTQNEGGPELGAVRKHGFEKPFEINHTLGPLPDRYGIVVGGTGRYAGHVGAFREYNGVTGLDGCKMSGWTRMEIHWQRTGPEPEPSGDAPTHERRFAARAADAVYDRAAAAGVRARLGKLRDRRDVAVGLVGTSSVGGRPAQLTITLPGDGTVFTAPDGGGWRIVDGTGRFAGATGTVQEDRDAEEVVLRWRPQGRPGPER